MKPSFSLKWLFVVTALAALVTVALVKPRSIFAWVVVWSIVASYACCAVVAPCSSGRRAAFSGAYSIVGMVFLILFSWWPLAMVTARIFDDQPITLEDRFRGHLFYGRLVLSHHVWSALFGCAAGWLAAWLMPSKEE